ncbi:alpha/beta hydrolase [Spirosoma arcticum]
MEPSTKPTFVLVHGAFAGQYAWSLVKPQLEQAGYTVVTLDLPAHGDDTTPVSGATLDSYATAVVQRIDAQPGKVVLVGHSMGGMVISGVAEQIPDKLDKLVYLSAYLPKNGQSLLDLSGQDSQSLIGPNLKLAADFTTATLPNDITVQTFAADCSDDIKKLVVDKSRPEPLSAFQDKITLTDSKFGKVSKYYVQTLKDQGVGTLLQQKMIADNSSILKTYTIDSSHSPYFAKPDELVSILKQLN